MTPAWFLTSLLLPPAAALGAWLVLRGRTVPPHLVIVLNALVPGAGLAAAGSPQLEVAGGVLFAIVSLLTVGRVEDIGYWLPIMGIGGAWGLLHTPFNPLARQLTGERPRGEELADRPPAPAAVAVAHPTVARPTADRPGEADAQEETGYAVSIRCTECGADLDVPVLQRMARCPYCASDHLIVGHDEELLLAVPERIQSEAELREAILDHYRYQYYLKLYQRHVAPLERRAVEATPQGALTTRPEVDAAAAAAERAVAQRADAHRRKLEDKLWTGSRLHFMAPYRHGMGTLYQAAFGRTLQGLDKELHFAVAVLEASTLASAAVDLPPMGKLSYLKALLPAAQLGEGARTLPLEHGEEALGRAFGELDRKKLVRDLTVIRQGTVFNREVSAVVWRGWWTVQAKGPDFDDHLLVDAASGSVVGAAPPLDPTILTPLPPAALTPGSGLRFLPMECPTCGFEFTFDVNAVLHFCHNCHRVCTLEGGRKVEVAYDHMPRQPEQGEELVPFWRFELRLHTGDGSLVTDLFHLKDGIDGTLDQIGDEALVRQDVFFVPAFRCINSRLTMEAFRRLFLHTLRQPPPVAEGRFPLDIRPHPWPVGLPEGEARGLAPLYLAMAFSHRDMARVKADQVQSWLFDSRLESCGRLTYLYVPRPLTETFRAYVGRFRAPALADADAGTSPR